MSHVLSVGLVDAVQLRRQLTGIACVQAGFTVTAYATVAECAAADGDVDVLLYFPCGGDVTRIVASVALLREHGKPLLVITDTSFLNEKYATRALLAGGAQGYLPSETTDVTTAVAAIRFVAEGGVYAPVDKLLNNQPKREDDEDSSELTPRQKQVLDKLRIGQPNKIIAYELEMSESTVKVHIRNLMRRLGATNRTQAVYKAQLLAA